MAIELHFYVSYKYECIPPFIMTIKQIFDQFQINFSILRRDISPSVKSQCICYLWLLYFLIVMVFNDVISIKKPI